MGHIIKVFKESMLSIASYVVASVDVIKEYQIEEFIKILLDSYSRGSKVIVVGAGRSGLIGRAFAMRLMHLGFNVYVLGDTIVPSLRPNDLMIAISGSGRTKLVITVAEAAKSVGAKVIALTTYINSPLAKIADMIVEVPGRTKIS
ncbi:MAG: SIS domain-containing protein, partial [Sulfolobales archaeon]